MVDLRLRELERDALQWSGDPSHDAPLFMASAHARRWERWHCRACGGSGKWAPRYNDDACPSCGGTGEGTHDDRYELAAYLGHPGAREWCSEPPLLSWTFGTRYLVGGRREPECDHFSLEAWLRGLEHWRPGQEFLGAGAHEAAKVMLAIGGSVPDGTYGELESIMECARTVGEQPVRGACREEWLRRVLP